MGFYENEEDAFLPLRDVVFKQLREEILYGKLKPGERLMEIALSERLGVSRTPVREGIRLLKRKGLSSCFPEEAPMSRALLQSSLRTYWKQDVPWKPSL